MAKGAKEKTVNKSNHKLRRTVLGTLSAIFMITAIIVAWMAKFNPIAMVVISLLLVFMQQGAIQIASQFSLNENASDIITGILLFFLIGCEFFIHYQIKLHKKSKEVQS